MQKLLITGSTGFVGGRLKRQLGSRYELLTPTRDEFNAENTARLRAYLQQHQPQCIIHTAAFSDVGYCEAHPEQSRQVNIDWPEQIAKLAYEMGIKLVFFSSDQVYTGTDQPGALPENASICPKNVYGRHKLSAEHGVLSSCPTAVCLRASWMYDTAEYPDAKNSTGLPGQLLAAAQSGGSVACNPYEYRGVTWVGSLVAAMPNLMCLPGGVYNAGAENTLDSHTTALAMAQLMNLDSGCVRKKEGAAPRNLAMSTDKLQNFGIYLGTTMNGLCASLSAKTT